MKEKRPPQPPAWAQRFIQWYCKPGLADDLIGDLNEYFERNVRTIGPFRAKCVYVVDAFKFIRSYTVRRPTFIHTIINWIMIGSYIKTSARNLTRNKLFSTLNIVGLAVSMSVGLLLIAFLLDLRSYDRFHRNGDRIYRITNVLTTGKNGSGTKYASTSIKAGRLIREKVTGVEDVAIVRNDFSKDARIGDQVIPVKGYWAEPSFLKMFSFPLLSGNTDAALKEPYSVVLTETAARKLFGDEPPVGKAVRFDDRDYQITGVMKDVPFFSHITFEALVSFATLEAENRHDPKFDAWNNMGLNYVYVLVDGKSTPNSVQAQLDALAQGENIPSDPTKIRLELLPLYNIMVGENLHRTEGARGGSPHMSPTMLWILGALALVVVLSACFNYTNLSIARATRRFKEIGLRKSIGAGRAQVQFQFLTESILIALGALVLSYLMFLVLRPELIHIAPEMQRLVKLELTPTLVIAFVCFSVTVGVLAGFMPSVFFSRVSTIQALRSQATVRVFKNLSLRRSLIVVQYTLALIFMTATSIGYVQYKDILAFDLGFETENILNVNMQGNKPDALMKALSEMPEVTALSRSLIVNGVGNAWGGFMKYRDRRDSALVLTNHIDENYLALHEHKMVAGGNFRSRPTTSQAATELIVNQQFLKRFAISPEDPEKAIGEEVTFSNFKVHDQRLTIVGVIQDFHYGKVDNLIEPTAFLFWTPGDRAIVNVKIQSSDMVTTMAKIEAAWKGVDPVHPFVAEFFTESIEDAYSEFSAMIKVIGFLSLLAISISSLGLFGMVVFTTETRLKEIGIRKVMGATSGNLVFLLSRGFLVLISISALVALPVTYLFFERVILTRFPYHTPVHFVELIAGFLAVSLVAFVLIGSQTWKAARTNPTVVLRGD